MPPRSPLAPEAAPKLPPLAGVRLATAACGIRYEGRTDVCLMELAPGTKIAGVLTRSLVSSAPVDWCRRLLKGGRARAILVNSGNANAFTGRLGEASVRRCAAAVAGALGCRREEIYLASTGVIGEPLPDERITAALPGLARALAADAWAEAGAAIMTTDTFVKLATRTARIGRVEVRINGIAKGSGMIAPDMATMLAFVATDAKLSASVLRSLLREGAERSFNCISIDGDTSTSDTLLLAATGAGPAHPSIARPSDPSLKDFKGKLQSLLVDLACQVVRDGEGAGKFITIDVSGADTDPAARRIALVVANSPLVKTAIAGGDANWGRIVMAVGKAGEKANRDRLKISIGGIQVAARGQRVPAYDEAPVAAHMAGREIAIAIDVGVGKGLARIWTCDLTHGYVDINADYRS
jgi:glutamate N-acetyltransferase / amino-acid N-acetyltransferase